MSIVGDNMDQELIQARNRVARTYGEDIAQDLVVAALLKLQRGTLPMWSLDRWAMNYARYLQLKHTSTKTTTEALSFAIGDSEIYLATRSGYQCDPETRIDLKNLLETKAGQTLQRYVAGTGTSRQLARYTRRRLKEKSR